MTWPKSVWMSFGLFAVLAGVAMWTVYSETREAYRKVGFNTGSLSEREKVIESMRGLGLLEDCRNFRQQKPIEFLSVKSEQIFAVKMESGVTLCEY
ncbi:hypothetical protein [Massilia pseudoviolaceinigra]|uniref:hypothetical protein n=1 Tax=Massilia pseudoviolaceinigra TaxID=3057165 RepID=UPI00279669A9|nr:hypothetical protein [Massilia sp. CCM 9206]MDQ1924875.1 hypothetical protein [Massilia sp. CCM 9206]